MVTCGYFHFIQDASSFYFQAYFSVTINGLQVGKVKSKITSQMSQVKVYAGDADLPAANAQYTNLIWETISGGACLTYAFTTVNVPKYRVF